MSLARFYQQPVTSPFAVKSTAMRSNSSSGGPDSQWLAANGVPDALLDEAVELAKWARPQPTSRPCHRLRSQPAAKLRLKGALAPGNVDKTMAAPVTAILGHDTKFYDLLSAIPPCRCQGVVRRQRGVRQRHCLQDGTLQVAYFILALRAVGLDTGPMSGFDNAAVDADFFPGGQIKSNVLVTSATAIAPLFSHATRDWNSPRSRRTSERDRACW